MPPQNQQDSSTPQAPIQPQPGAQLPQPGANQPQYIQPQLQPADGSQPSVQNPTDPAAPQPYRFPAQSVQEPEGTPYDFFMESPKSRKGMGFDSSPVKKLVMMVGLVVVVLSLLAIILALASKPTGNSNSLIAIAQEQTELMRVAADGAKNSHNTDIQNFAVTTQVSLSSTQQKLLNIMAKQGVKTTDKTLVLGHSAKTDQALQSAIAADTYDSTFSSIMRANLSTYVHDLNQEEATATSKAELNVIKDADAGAQLLQKILPQQ